MNPVTAFGAGRIAARNRMPFCGRYGLTLGCCMFFGVGCASTSQQQPQPAATSAAARDGYHNDFAPDGPNARQPDPPGSDQFAGTNARSRQIERDLGVQ